MQKKKKLGPVLNIVTHAFKFWPPPFPFLHFSLGTTNINLKVLEKINKGRENSKKKARQN